MGEVTAPGDIAAMELAQFQHQCDQMMFWINYKEVIVWPEELRGIPETGPALQEKYAKFNEEVNSQEVRVEEIFKVAELMIANGHPADMLIRQRREELKQSWQRMRKLALKRQMLVQDLGPSQPDQPAPEALAPEKPKSLKEVASEAQLIRGLLEDFLRLEQFEKDCCITKGWIDQTMAIMTDNSHLDPTNLNVKMENHKLLEQDVMGRKDRAEILTKIQIHLVEILKMWEDLLAATELKSLHMSQAWQLEKFNHGVDNMDAWLTETETVLKSPDFGNDLPTVELLLKEHALMIKDIRTHKDIVDIISTAATQFSESGHFDLKTIVSRKDQVVKRYSALAGLIKERERKLNDSHKAHQLFNDIDVEEKWIVEKQGRIAGRGQDIETIRQLIRETQSIMQEMHAHDPHVQKIIEYGHKLAKGHHLNEEITKRTNDLAEHWAELKQRAFDRKQSNQLVLLFLFSIKD